MVAWFVISQPSGAFRGLVYLSPVNLITFAPVGVLAFIVSWLVTKKYQSNALIVAITFLVLAICLWYFIQQDPLSSLLLPPIDHK